MHWWQSAVLYQIYPRSFQDGNGDGVGDLPGIKARLPYLAELGVDAIWLSPIFVSPMVDFGYDIADYTGIDPLFGSMVDFDTLLEAAHRLGIKILLDFVPNHTSERHPWFVDARASRNNPKRDWYLWRDGASGGGPPNNWLSEFGGPAWSFDAATGQFYHHAFLPAQPDLNWRNAQVRAAMHDVMRFWLARGVDGFRVDVMWHLIKDDAFRDNPPNPDYRTGDPPYRRLLPLYSADRPEVHEVVRGLRAVIDEFPERVLIGEIYLPVEKLVAYYGRDLAGVHLPFNFALLETPWRAEAIAQLVERYEAALPPGAWPNWVLGNHDRVRLADPRRAGAGEGGGHVAADVARHADALLWRRDRHATGADPSGPRTRSRRGACARPRRRAHADAMGRERPRRIFRRRTLVAAGGRFRRHECRGRARRPWVFAQSLPPATRRAPNPAGADPGRLSVDRGGGRGFDLCTGGSRRPCAGGAEFRVRPSGRSATGGGGDDPDGLGCRP